MSVFEKFPSISDLQTKVKEAGITGQFQVLDGVILNFLARLADQEKEGNGLFVDWQLSVEEAFESKYSVIVRKSVHAQFPRIIDTLVTKQEVKKAAVAAYYK